MTRYVAGNAVTVTVRQVRIFAPSLYQTVGKLSHLTKTYSHSKTEDLVGEYYAAVGNPFEDPIYMHLIHHDI